MAKGESKQQKQVNLKYPQQYILSLAANRFLVERQDDFTLAHFGFVVQNDEREELADAFSCVFTSVTLENLKENIVQYSDGIGLPKVPPKKWKRPSFESRRSGDAWSMQIIDFIHLSNWNNTEAEICFWNYSQGHVADLSRAGSRDIQVTPWGAAMVRCSLDLQRAFLEALY